VHQTPLQSDGTIHSPTTTKNYNLLNQLISETDENGHTTTTTYNVYGNPTQITRPDGAQESYTYTPKGRLKQKTNPDNTTITYQHDPKGHLLEETHLDPQGNILKKETYSYKTHLLQTKTDAMGLTTTYQYDGAGRKIKEQIGNTKTILYTYDDHGRLIKKEQEGRQEIYEYDWLDRLTAKTLQDQGTPFAKEAYSYNLYGKQTHKTIWQTPEQTAHYWSHYHSDGRIKCRFNPLNQVTIWDYKRPLHELSGQVQVRIIHDPLGRPHIETEDTHHRLATTESFDKGRQVSLTRYEYDPAGNCIKEHSLIMADGQPLREYWLQKQYNNRGHLATQTEQPQGRKTQYHYDNMGRLAHKIKPDGVGLLYTYDALGRLKTLTSTDNTIAYTYSYDLHDNITQIQDHIQGRLKQRTPNDAQNVKLKMQEKNPTRFRKKISKRRKFHDEVTK
jgi:YD repeat-containing protein